MAPRQKFICRGNIGTYLKSIPFTNYIHYTYCDEQRLVHIHDQIQNYLRIVLIAFTHVLQSKDPELNFGNR